VIHRFAFGVGAALEASQRKSSIVTPDDMNVGKLMSDVATLHQSSYFGWAAESLIGYIEDDEHPTVAR
jgi:hypothetical protein